jgi:hypothetical protein
MSEGCCSTVCAIHLVADLPVGAFSQRVSILALSRTDARNVSPSMSTRAKERVSPSSLHSRPRSICELSCCAIPIGSIAHSLEVRVPLVDDVVSCIGVNLAKRWPATSRPYPWRAVLNLAKRGFSTSVPTWIQQQRAAHQCGDSRHRYIRGRGGGPSNGDSHKMARRADDGDLVIEALPTKSNAIR